MRTFSIETLGCKVNQYESDQIAAYLRGRGLQQVDPVLRSADLRVVNTCSVTVQAASRSRQTVRRTTRLPVLSSTDGSASRDHSPSTTLESLGSFSPTPRTVVTGCWTSSDPEAARRLPGVDAVLRHHVDVAAELSRLLDHWLDQWDPKGKADAITNPPLHDNSTNTQHQDASCESETESIRNEGWMIRAGTPAPSRTLNSKPPPADFVKENSSQISQMVMRASPAPSPVMPSV